MSLPKEILGALELGPAIHSTLEASFHLSELLGAKLRLVHVHPPVPSVLGLVLGKDRLAKAEEEEREKIVVEAESAAREWGLAQVPVVEFIRGDPGDELVKLTGPERLLVLSVHGGGQQSYGSTARRVVRGAVGSLLCVQARHGFEAYRSVLVAIDANEAASRAVELAHELARREKAKLEALHVFAGPTRGLLSLLADEKETAALLDKVKAEAERSVQPLIASLSPVPRLGLVEGIHPARRIAPFAQLGHHDLIVMGSRIDPERRDMVLGSVADELVALATQDVLIVKTAV